MWKRNWRAAPLALAAMLLLGGAEGIDKHELECEEAVKHLIDCCPDDGPAKLIECYVGRGCEDSHADLSGPQARCLRDASCDALYASGACARPKQSCLP
jgi:hypothetical protein